MARKPQAIAVSRVKGQRSRANQRVDVEQGQLFIEGGGIREREEGEGRGMDVKGHPFWADGLLLGEIVG